MLHSIIDYNDIFCSYHNVAQGICRSSNPYDYICSGYYLDHAKLFGGKNHVSFNCDISSHISGNMLDISNK